ncbi:hypothetical protein [Natrarchaeobaculum sulfurireducens]|uniref:hypothetical protein n=1 Tax=Natrarchaeobaculum sulfurireducens TaxID=2044521 RepID=UPI00105AB0DA|nr:hypothetical protein [Natrarchaeobaculum sulfurireducens]
MSDDVSVSAEDYNENGIACSFDDGSVDDYCDAGETWYFAAPLKEADSGFEPGSRQVWAVYSHLDEQKAGGSVTISFGSLGYTSANNPEAWQRHRDDDGDQLTATDQDEEDICGGPYNKIY